jgi:succinate dehydrogenase/fumarate reductase flavoprotein subunit
MALGRPGLTNPRLVDVLAEEGEARVREMMDLGLCFRRGTNGAPVRHPGCGSRQPRAVIFDDIVHAFNQYSNKTISCGVEYITGTEVAGLVRLDGAARGAWGIDTATGEAVLVRARAVVMALGGPAPLFARQQAGPGNPGLSLGMLAEAGAETANEPYLQFMWGRDDASFLNPSALLSPGNRLLLPDGTRLAPSHVVGSDLDDLRGQRALHCPVFHHRPQGVLDRLLLRAQHEDDFARVETPGGVIRAGLFAHAGNGGAVVDEYGHTSLPGLFAAGECATGMHGANRLGGAMVLATQVFGRRAGLAAARHAAATQLPDMRRFRERFLTGAGYPKVEESAEIRRTVREISHGLDCHALPGGNSGDRKRLEKFRDWLTELTTSPHRHTRLAAMTALLVSAPTGDPFLGTS